MFEVAAGTGRREGLLDVVNGTVVATEACLIGRGSLESGLGHVTGAAFLAEQRVRINLDLTVADNPAIDDDYDNVVCYGGLVTGVRRVIGAGHVNLAETLAERIADMCLEDRRVLSARVRVEKLDVFAEAASVGVEIERFQRRS